MRRLAPLLLALTALAFAPSSSIAATGAVVDGQLRYTEDPGERTGTSIKLSDSNDAYVIAAYGEPAPVQLRAGPGCAAEPGQLRCTKVGVTSIAFSLGDRDDGFQIGRIEAPLSVSGGPGTDSVGYHLQDGAVGRTITADGQADDGPAGRDNIATDVETIFGDIFADTLLNGPGGGRLVGREGDDRLTGNSGDDVIEAAYVSDVGTDSGHHYFHGTDTVRCGGGHDMVFADSTDVIGPDCEVVAKNTKGGFRFTGSQGADRIGVPYGWTPAGLYGRGGGDLLIGATYGPTNIYGGTGDDRIQGSGGTPDRLEGGSGNDRIRARDKRPRRDSVRCGRGRDTAIVDRLDSVSGCERVLRSR
jgi:hypothetical protein